MAKKTREAMRQRRHQRVRLRLSGTPERPRLNVYRSLKAIYAQVIDDSSGHTLAQASTIDKEMQAAVEGKTPVEQARLVGQKVAERAKAKGIEAVVFDRGGYRYHGRIKALADGAREGGLKF